MCGCLQIYAVLAILSLIMSLLSTSCFVDAKMSFLRVEATSNGGFQVVFINVTNNPQTMT